MAYKNKTIRIKKVREYYKKNKEEINKKRQQVWAENKDNIKGKYKKYQSKRNAKVRWLRKNDPEYREKMCKYQRQWRIKNASKQASYKKKSILKNQYGLSLEEYQKLVEQNNGGCHICGEVKPGTNCRNGLCVDHNHKTGKNRGLLCHSCNRALGLFGDDTQKIEKAVEYLKKYEIYT